MDSYYVLSLNILKALGGDTSIIYPDADAIWVEINKIYNNAGNRFDIVPLEKNITENGQYDYYPDGDADAFMPVNINVNVPQKYTDEQVFEIESNAIQQGYNQGYVEGEAEGKLTGREEGYTDGYNTGYGTGVTDGGNAQKAKLVDITITENGVYTKDDGYKTVTVEIEAGIPEEELQQMLQEAMDEGYHDGYAEGVDDGREDGIAEQKEKLESTTFRDNGTYTKEDGWNEVTVQVDVPTFETETLSVELKSNGNYNYTPTTDGYSSVSVTVDVDTSGGGATDKPKIYNGFRFTGGDMAAVDFSQYDWSRVYDTLSFFEGTTHSTGDWSNFESGFNGKFYNCNRMFYGCSNLTSVPQLNTSNSISTNNMFYGCSNLTSVPLLNLSKSTDANRMFYGCSNLTDVSISNTNKVTNMSYMFSNCSKLTSISPLDASNVTNMEATFYNCSNLTDVSISNTSKVTNMNNLFYNCSKLTSVPQIDTSKVTSTNRMFYGCSNLTSVPHLDLSEATTMIDMFNNCSKLTNIASISNTSKVTSITSTFRQCYSLTSIPYFDTSNVTNMEYAFGNCSSLTTMPQLDYSKVTTTAYMFQGCSEMIELPDFNTVKATNFGGYSYNSWLSYSNKLQKLGAVNCDSVTNIDYFFGGQVKDSLTDFGGCINLGAKSSVSNTNSNYFMLYAPNLNYQSLLNVLNGLYDRKTAGYGVLTLKLHANHKAMLSDDDIAIATNKGWTIS